MAVDLRVSHAMPCVTLVTPDPKLGLTFLLPTMGICLHVLLVFKLHCHDGLCFQGTSRDIRPQRFHMQAYLPSERGMVLAEEVLVALVLGMHCHIHIILSLFHSSGSTPAIREGHGTVLADEVLVALVLGVNRHSCVPQDGLWPRCCHWQKAALFICCRALCASQRIAEVVQRALLLNIVHLQQADY